MTEGGRGFGHRIVRGVGRVLLLLHAPSFRREFGPAFLDAVEHRWRLEAARGRGATVRALRVLFADLGPSLMAAWRRASPGPPLVVLDLRLALRGLVRRPGFSALVVLTLGLGIGSSASILGALDRFVLRPLPFDDAPRMAFIGLESPQTGFVGSPTQGLLDRWRAARSIEAFGVFRERTVVLTDRGVPERLDRRVISGNLPRLVGLRPVLGRALVPDDARADADPAVMLGEAYWRRAFGADPGVLGRTLSFNDSTFTVVGVWPARATLGFGAEPALWTAIPEGREADPSSFTRVLAVMAEGAEPDQVRAELAQLAAGVDVDRVGDRVPTVLAPQFFLGDDFVTGLWVTSAGALLLLFVGVLNAANLLLNRAVTRRPETGLRLALGAPAGRIFRLYAIEGLTLVLLGTGLGLALAQVASAALAAVAPSRFPDLAAPLVGSRTIAWGAVVAGAAAALCALVSALHLRAHEGAGRLVGRRATPGRTRHRARTLLVGVQVALALVLAVGAGLGLRSFRTLAEVDPGFDLDPLAVVAVSLPSARYPDADVQDAFMRRAEESLRALPGVEGVAISGVPPFSFSTMSGEPTLVGEPLPEADGRWTSQASASPGYFDVMGIPVLEGRAPDARDAAAGQLRVLVNETFARRWPGSVVGRSLRFPHTETTMEIIGVVGDVRSNALTDGRKRVQYYVVDRGAGGSYTRFLLRARDPEAVVAAARARIAELDPLLIPSVSTGRELLRAQTADQRFLAFLLGAFGTLGVAVAMLGVYGSVSLAVSERTREIGVRVALGSATAGVVRHVLVLGLRPAAAGAAVGLVAALAGARWVESALYEVGALDPAALVGALLVLGSAAALACLVPARRALGIDPSRTLNAE